MFDISSLVKKYKEFSNFASFDVETTGLRPYHGDKIFSYCFGTNDYCIVRRLDKAYFAEIKTNDLLKCITSKDNIWEYIKISTKFTTINNFEILQKYFQENWKDTSTIIHNCKFEKGFCKVHGVEFPNDLIIHDTMLMSRELDNQSPSHELGKLVHRLGGDPLEKMIECDTKVNKEFKRLKGYQYIDVSLMTEYQLYDAVRPLMLMNIFWDEIKNNDKLLEDYIYEVKTALYTQDMEEDGIPIHRQNCNSLLKWLNSEIEKMQHESFKIIGEYINLNSDQQIRRILFERFFFPVYSLTDKAKAKVDKDAIFELQEKGINHPFLDLLLKWRSYTDGRDNINSYVHLADENGIIHANGNTCQAKTARQSWSKPNLNNVTKENALKNPYPVPARKCFKCPNNCVLFMPDYSGIQFRLIIWRAQEKEFIDLLKKDKYADCHTPAAKVFYREIFTDIDKCIEFMLKKSPDNEKILKNNSKEDTFKIFQKILRSAAKNANFAKPFYANKNKLAKTLMLSEEELNPGFEEYKFKWPGIFFFSQNEYKIARHNGGFIETPFGTKIYAPESELYKIGNYDIQHMEAKIVKRGEVRCMEYFKMKYSTKLINILFPVHDELVIKFNRSLLKNREEILTEIQNNMEYCPEIDIPMVIEWKMTNSVWSKVEKVEI